MFIKSLNLAKSRIHKKEFMPNVVTVWEYWADNFSPCEILIPNFSDGTKIDEL